MLTKATYGLFVAFFGVAIAANAAVTNVSVSASDWQAAPWNYDVELLNPAVFGGTDATLANAMDGSLQATIIPSIFFIGQGYILAIQSAGSYNLQNATLRFKWLMNGQIDASNCGGVCYAGLYTGVTDDTTFKLYNFGYSYFTTGWVYNSNLVPNNTWLYTQLDFSSTSYAYHVWQDGYGGSNVLVSGTVAINPTTWSGLANARPYFQFGDNYAANAYFEVAEMSIVTAAAPPVLQGAASRAVHGAAGTFDLPLSTVTPPSINHNPTTEPRQGPNHTLVLTFDKPVTAASATITEGTATPGVLAFSGNDVVIPLSGVTDQQYVTVSLGNVASSDGGTGGSGSARVGFLVGDVNQNRVVTVADLGLVNSQLAQLVTAANFLKDVNASGAISVADKGITNANLTRNLPAP